MKPLWSRLGDFIGIESAPVSHKERWVSASGGFVAILLILVISDFFVGARGAALVVASMGASAVLLFAVPHGPLSQPWPVAGGHLISALIGVSCAKWVPEPYLAAALGVGLAIGAMHYLRCIHPPGGASALAAVVGGSEVHALGYQFVITPVLVNVLVMLAIAVLFNLPFEWRRYPASLKPKLPQALERTLIDSGGESISHADLVYALSEIDSFIDVDEQDLLRIYELATHRMQRNYLLPGQIVPGHYYSNGKTGDQREVRQVLDESGSQEPGRDTVSYKNIAGAGGQRSTGVATRAEFAHWARCEVVRQENAWQAVDGDTS